MWLCTKSHIACTRPQPGGVFLKWFHAIFVSRSVSQYRLASRYGNVSAGNSPIKYCRAEGTTGSAIPVERTTADVLIVVRPAGNSSRRHQLPNPSRYAVTQVTGLTSKFSGVTISYAWL